MAASIPRDLFDGDLEGFRQSFNKFLQQEAVPHHAGWEKDGQVSRALWQKAGEMGYLCPELPEEYGGSGADYRYCAVISEEIASLGLSGVGFGLHSDIVAPYILHYGCDYIKSHYLPKMASGELISAIAMTEPGAGSDLQGVRTTAVKDGEDYYILNGSKTFITNGQMADIVVVVAKTNPAEGAKGISLFLVEAAWEGFSKGRNLEKVGMKAQDTSELFFQDVRVPASNMLGPENSGFVALMKELPQERLMVGINAVASCEAAIRWTIDYCKERKSFGKPLMHFQNTRFKLAEMTSEVTAARVFVDRCLELHLDRKLDIPTAAMVKQLTTDLQCRVTDECVQLHGGYGYMWEYPIARAWADARVQKIYAGTNEIMKEIIARSL